MELPRRLRNLADEDMRATTGTSWAVFELIWTRFCGSDTVINTKCVVLLDL
jgi:hypothetical protein